MLDSHSSDQLKVDLHSIGCFFFFDLSRYFKKQFYLRSLRAPNPRNPPPRITF